MKALKIISIMISLLILANIALASEIFNAEINDNVPFTINGIKHIARYYDSAKKVSLLAGDERELIAIEDCEDIGSLKYCIDSASVGYSEETGDPASTMMLRVIESGPEITISRSIPETEPNLNEEIEIIATVTNTGNERALNVVYEDSFPIGVKVSSANLNYATNGVVWSGSLNPEESHTIKYRVTFSDFVNFESVAKASFIFNNKIRKLQTSSVSIDVQKPFTISDALSSKSADIGEAIEYTLNITNKDAAAIRISKLLIKIPEGTVAFKKDFGLDTTSEGIEFSGSIEAGNTKTISLSFKSMNKIQDELVTTASIQSGTKTFKEEFNHKIGIGVSAIIPIINFSSDEVKGGRELEIYAYVINEGEISVGDISIDLSSNLIDNKGWRHIELDSEKKHVAFNKIISAPLVDTKTKFYVKLNGQYITGSGKNMLYSLKKDITIIPAEKVLEITPIFKIIDKEVNVTVHTKNIAAYSLSDVSVIDSIPKGFSMLSGERYKDIEQMTPGEEVEYSYLIKPPETFTGKDFTIKHIISAKDQNKESISLELKSIVNLTQESTNTVTTEDPESEVQKNETNTTIEETTPAETENTDKGIFSKIINWIKKLF